MMWTWTAPESFLCSTWTLLPLKPLGELDTGPCHTLDHESRHHSDSYFSFFFLSQYLG